VSLSGSFAVGLVSAVIIVGLIGVAIELFLLKPLYGKDPLLPLLLTFGLSVAIPDVVKIVFGLTGKPVDYPETFGGATIVGPLILSNYRLFIIVFTLAILLSLWFFLKKSDLGMIIRAATRDSLMVQILGTNTSGIWTIGFAIGTGLAALAGAIAVPMLAATPDMGVEMTMVAFVVTVVGGLGSLGGAIVGGLLIGVIVAFTSLIAGEYSSVAMYFCMAVILLIRPRGLFGESGRE
jgi:branched-chain amino acid transport system permease protein